MANFNDFDLDIVAVATDSTDTAAFITSKSLCSLGCITGILMNCNVGTVSCQVISKVSTK